MPRALLAAVLVLGLWGASRASANEGYNGTYDAGPASVRAQVDKWGADCGLKPKSYTLNERPQVKVTSRSGHLFMKFPDRTLRTNACWSPNPALRISSSAGSDVRWSTKCRTPRGDSKAELGMYTVTANGPFSLELSEVSDYNWQLNNSQCKATVRITRRLERVAVERAKEPVPLEEVAQPASADCLGVPGPAARLSLRPGDKKITPGSKVCFRPRAVDARGCSLGEVDVQWELRKPAAARGSLRGNCFVAAELAAEAEGKFRVVASLGKARASALITVAADDLSDITAKRAGGSVGLAPGSAGGLSGTTSSAGVQSTALRRGPSLGLVLAAVAAALALLMGVVVMIRRRALASAVSREPSRMPSSIFEAPSDPAPPRGSGAPGAAASAPAPAAVPAAPVLVNSSNPSEPMICPTCRTQHLPALAACPNDGTTLVPYSKYTSQMRDGAGEERECSRCGASCGPDVQFCGACGAPL